MNDLLHEHEIDPEMKAMLELLKPVPERTPEAVAQGRAIFMAELDRLYTPGKAPNNNLLAMIMVWMNFIKEVFAMKSLVFRSVFVVLALVILVLGSAGMTARASAGALPGDALYGVKTGLEQARVSLTNDAAAQAQLYLALANRRLEEMNALIESGRYAELADLAQDFQNYLGKAMEALKTVARDDPARAADLNAEIMDSMAKFALALQGIFARLPEANQAGLLPALQAVQGPAAGAENSNANTNGNANDDNTNGNSNSNGNANDDNSNGNANDDNTNGNANDDNSNGNANDDNSNSNDDGGNDNGNDDGGNDNGSDDGGGGGGGNDDGNDDGGDGNDDGNDDGGNGND